jgi:hypothetical protein
VAGDQAGCLRLWDTKTGKHEVLVETAKLRGARKRPQAISMVQLSPDGKTAYFSLSQGSVYQCSLDGDKKKGRLFPNELQLFAGTSHGLSPDGKLWVESVTLFEPERSVVTVRPNLLGRRELEIVGDPEALFEQEGRVELAAVGDAGVVVSVTSTGMLRRWKKDRRKPAWEEKLGRFRATALALGPRNEVVAVGGEGGQVRLYAADSGKLLHVLAGHAKAVTALAFSPDGKRLASGGADGAVRVWGVGGGKELAVLKGHAGRVNAVAYGPGDRIVTGGSDRTVRVWQWSKP